MNLSIKTLFLFLFAISPLTAHAVKKEPHEVTIEVKIKCPMSEELKEFVKSIPAPDEQSVSFDDWKESFTTSMEHFIRLVESGKICDAHWSAKTDDALPGLVEKD